MDMKTLKTIKKCVMLAAALTLAWGCSSSSDVEEETKPGLKVDRPRWAVDFSGNSEQPAWGKFDRSMYESWMYIPVKLEDELAVHATTDDRMAVFIGDEMRTLPAVPNIHDDGSVYFVLTVGGSNDDRGVKFALRYYSAKLRQLFTLEGVQTFAPELYYGNTTDFVPPLLSSCTKYPIQRSLTVTLPAKPPFTPADDIVAVFVGDECRGVGKIGTPFVTYRTSASETLQLRCYSSQQMVIYDHSQTITDEQSVTFSF